VFHVTCTIESYGFGHIVIDGKRYTSDVIIFPDRVKDGWWRKEGHKLHIEDIEEVLREKPEILIVGTGYAGLMKVPKEVQEHIRNQGIELIIENTRNAWKTYNKLAKTGKKVIAAFHLTC